MRHQQTPSPGRTGGLTFVITNFAAAAAAAARHYDVLPEQVLVPLEAAVVGFAVFVVTRWLGKRAVARAGVVLLILSLTRVSHAQEAEEDDGQLARITVATKHTSRLHEQFDATGESLGFAQVTTGTVAAAYFAPMVTVSLVRVNLERRADYRAGVVPGIGYGFHWSPSWYDDDGDHPFVSVGVFLEGGLLLNADGADYAAVTVLPAITVMRWFSVGLGYETRIALTDDAEDDGAPVLALGIASAF